MEFISQRVKEKTGKKVLLTLFKIRTSLLIYVCVHIYILLTLQGVEEVDRSSEGFYIRSGITVILKNAKIKDGTVI